VLSRSVLSQRDHPALFRRAGCFFKPFRFWSIVGVYVTHLPRTTTVAGVYNEAGRLSRSLNQDDHVRYRTNARRRAHNGTCSGADGAAFLLYATYDRTINNPDTALQTAYECARCAQLPRTPNPISLPQAHERRGTAKLGSKYRSRVTLSASPACVRRRVHDYLAHAAQAIPPDIHPTFRGKGATPGRGRCTAYLCKRPPHGEQHEESDRGKLAPQETI
jgi:hypothetical protein